MSQRYVRFLSFSWYTVYLNVDVRADTSFHLIPSVLLHGAILTASSRRRRRRIPFSRTASPCTHTPTVRDPRTPRDTCDCFSYDCGLG